MEVELTNHAKHRIKVRKILKQEVIDAIKYPDNTDKRHGKYYFQKKLERGTIEICCEKIENNIKVITIYWL